AGRRAHAQRIDGLRAGLVPAGDEAPGVRVLELGEDRPLRLAALAGVVEGEEAGGLLVDRPRVFQRELIAAGRHAMVEDEGRRLLVLVEDDLRAPALDLVRRRNRAGPRIFAEDGALDGQVRGVQDDAVGGRLHIERDDLVAGEGQVRDVWRDDDAEPFG